MITSLAFAALASAVPAPTSITVAHYLIEIPAGYVAKDVSPPMMDFDLYMVTRQGRKEITCTLYFGNHPSFPKLQWSKKPVETKGDKRTAKAFQRPGAIEGVIEFSGLTYQHPSGTPFGSIHYFGDKLDDGAVKDMLRMIASIKVTRPHLN